MMKTKSLWLLLALLAPGCANVGPDFQKPEADVTASWLSADDARVDAEATQPEAWWGVFGDATLTALIEEAFNQNLTVEIAGLRIMEARARLGYAVGLKYPQSQSVGGGYSRSRSSKNAPPLGNLPDDVVNGAKTEVDVYSMSFDAAWEADVWGKFRRGVEAADANLAGRMLDYDAVLVTLAGDVAALYTTIRTYEQRLAYARANVQLQQESLSLAESRFRLGATSELDVEQAKAQLYNTEAVIPGRVIGLGRSRLVLSTLLGKPPATLEDSLGASGAIPCAPTSVAVLAPEVRRRHRLRAGSPRVGSIDILHIQEKEHIVWIVHRLPQTHQCHAVLGGYSTVRHEVCVPGREISDFVSNEQLHQILPASGACSVGSYTPIQPWSKTDCPNIDTSATQVCSLPLRHDRRRWFCGSLEQVYGLTKQLRRAAPPGQPYTRRFHLAGDRT